MMMAPGFVDCCTRFCCPQELFRQARQGWPRPLSFMCGSIFLKRQCQAGVYPVYELFEIDWQYNSHVVDMIWYIMILYEMIWHEILWDDMICHYISWPSEDLDSKSLPVPRLGRSGDAGRMSVQLQKACEMGRMGRMGRVSDVGNQWLI